MWPFFNYKRFLYPEEPYVWVPVRILHETKKAILITAPHVIARSEATKQSLTHCHSRASGNLKNDNIKIWIAKSQICGIRLRKNFFEIYVREGMVGLAQTIPFFVHIN